MKKNAATTLLVLWLIAPFFIAAQNVGDIWDSTSGASMRVTATADGMKYCNLSGGTV